MNLNNLIGTPYAQLDCYQLVKLVSKQLYKKDLPEVSDYSKNPGDVVDNEIAFNGWTELEKREVGCVVVLGQTPTYAKHVGIFIGSGILHTCRKYGAIIQDDFQLLASGYSTLRFYRWDG